MNTKKKNQKLISFFFIPLTVQSLLIVLLIILSALFFLPATESFADIEVTFGWVPPPREIEDQLIEEGKAGVVIVPNLPPSYILIDTMKMCSPVRGQGKIPSCVGFAVSSMMEFLCCQAHPNEDPVLLSPASLYCACKERDGISTCVPGEGTHIYTAIDVLMEEGIPPDNCYPYSHTELCCQNNRCQIPCESFIDSKTFIESRVSATDKIPAMKSSLYRGQVFVAGLTMFSNWDMINNADIPEPTLFDTVVGGHALCFVGYMDDPTWPDGGYFWFKNSWGADWGYEGFGRVSYAYMQAHAREIVMVNQSEIMCEDIYDPDIRKPKEPFLQGILFDFDSSKNLSLTGEIGKALHFSVVPRDEYANDTINYSLQSSPIGANYNFTKEGEFHWTPSSGGTYEFTIQATNDTSGASDTANLTIDIPEQQKICTWSECLCILYPWLWQCMHRVPYTPASYAQDFPPSYNYFAPTNAYYTEILTLTNQ